MDESVFQQPILEQLKQFAAGDTLAIDAVTELVLPQLYQWGARRSTRFLVKLLSITSGMIQVSRCLLPTL